jgi:eukaryotic-like serine/threonine-protein kinase
VSLSPSASLGRYEILSRLGAGGMGEVYLAQDRQLERRVALKVLPVTVAADEDRMLRFVREAKAAAALNHPHIAHIYEIGEADGTSFIAMELIEGETLREKIHREKTSLKRLLEWLAQVADGLAKAHAAGIVHRDLKPDNVMISRDGYAKILDFGLAKLVEPQPLASVEANSEAATAMMPQQLSTPGMIMGTVGYMSPEQARGQANIDSRSDVFSFGCILYEAVTRRQPFEGETAIDSLHKIIHAQPPPIKDFNAVAPADLQRIVRRCLAKDPEDRYQTIKDVGIELKELRREMESASDVELSIPPETTADGLHVSNAGDETISAGSKTTVATTAEATAPAISSAEYVVNQIKRHKAGAFIAIAAVTLAVAGLIFGLYKFFGGSQSPTSATVRVTPLTSSPYTERNPALSPDGRHVAFVWMGERGDNFDIYVKITDAGTPLRLTTSPEREMCPAWSPDGRFIAFLRATGENKGFYIVPALGGAERKIADAFGWNQGGVMPQAIDWSPDGKTLAVVDKTSEDEPWSIFLLSIETGEKRKLTAPLAYMFGDVFATFSPDGQTIAFVRGSGQTGNIFLVPVSGGDPVQITSEAVLNPRGLDWTSDAERLVFSSEIAGRSILWTIPATGGTPAPVAGAGENVWELSASLQGDRLVYSQGSIDTNLWRIEIPTRAGGGRASANAPTRFISSTRIEESPQFSPDGQRIVFASNRSGSSEIWVCDSEGQNPAQLTNFGANSASTGNPRWSPDGRFIAFDARVGGSADIYIISADGGSPRRLTTDRTEEIVPSWSRDGRFVYYASNRGGRREVWKMPASGGESVQVTREGGDFPFESMDGRVLYYTKGRSSFSSNLWSVSTEGGAETQVFDHRVGRSWAVVERGIYFFAYPQDGALPYTLEFFDFNTRQTTRLTTLEGQARAAAIFGITVSPNERWIVYAQRDRLDFDLMLVENFR